MKVLFAVSNEEISKAVIKKYQKAYKEIISYKNVYYFNAILKEIQKDKSYDRIVISEDLEAFTNTQYEQIDKFIFDKLDSISDEASNLRGEDIPIIVICSDRRTKSEQMLVKLFGIGVYNAILGNDRSIDEVCRLINKPRVKKEAKSYYQIDSEDVGYQSESENDVSETEIQNIIAHYKKLGKDEEQYVRSFDNIASQYNDIQLKIICKFLPLNVRAVLEERSPKYQQLMAFSPSVASEYKKQKEKSSEGLSSKLLKADQKISSLNRPVVVPSEVNLNNVKKLTRPRKQEINVQRQEIQSPKVEPIQNIGQFERNYSDEYSNYNNKINEQIPSYQPAEPVQAFDLQTLEKTTIDEAPKRKRGRPRKNPPSVPVENAVPKRRGRPRKNPLPETEKVEDYNPYEGITGFKNNNYNPPISDLIEEKSTMPGFENYNNNQPKEQEESIMPGFDNYNNNQPKEQEESIMPGFDNYNYNQPKEQEESIIPGFDNYNYNQPKEQEKPVMPEFNNEYKQPMQENPVVPEFRRNYNNNESQYIDISSLLTSDKKVVSFVGTSKNGTSFIVNNLAAYTSSMGINTAILDMTKNRNSYYIYTKNEEELRRNAADSINELNVGNANGIKENDNLTVYTALPNDHVDIENAGAVLQTLVNNYSLVLIDCDFDTPKDYFKQSQEVYLVQSLDVLTIQPLTAFLRDLQVENAITQDKIRIILNKCVNIRGINEKIIIGGMSCYNDPSMSFNTDLFNRDTVKYITIPFEEDIYTKYLESIINCNVSIRGYSKSFMQVLKDLKNMVYPRSNSGKKGYQPPKPSYNSRYR